MCVCVRDRELNHYTIIMNHHKSNQSFPLSAGFKVFSNPAMAQKSPKRSVGKAVKNTLQVFMAMNCFSQHRAPGVYKARISLEADVYFAKWRIV